MGFVRKRLWVVVAGLIATVGVGLAVWAASGVAHSRAAASRAEFEDAAAEVIARLDLSMLHEQDLLLSGRGFIADNPNATNADLRRWVGALEVPQRYPEVIGVGFQQIVAASELPAYARRVATDAPAGSRRGAPLRLIPAGRRAYYCLGPLLYSRDLRVAPPPGYDFCATDTTGRLLPTRDSGQGIYSMLDNGRATMLAFSDPVYRGGVVPRTTAARRAAFLGWVGMGIVPKVVLDRVLSGHAGMAVTMSDRRVRDRLSFSAGARPDHAQSVTKDLRSGWTVQTFGTVAGAGIFDQGSAIALLGAGIALSALLALLLYVLATGRARALRLVASKTDELRHQALHDALTGLPNRALVLDRAELLLHRSRRAGVEGAAMFIDVDEFKNVNDTLGHEAGDELLKAVADRFRTCVRDSDTLGRMGGDEFVVLLDGAPAQVAPELVAERVVDVMSQPFVLGAASMSVTVSVSIGVAIGDRPSASDLLRDADQAMYVAKNAGKNRFEVFRAGVESEMRDRTELEATIPAEVVAPGP